MKLHIIAISFLLGKSAVVGAQGTAGEPGLHSLMVAAGKLFFGTATETNLLNDAGYMSIVNNTNEFGLTVPENSQKWEVTEPTQAKFVFANPDRLFAIAKDNS